jgi:hypothetical protein
MPQTAPGYPLQVLENAHAFSAGFPLLSLAPHGLLNSHSQSTGIYFFSMILKKNEPPSRKSFYFIDAFSLLYFFDFFDLAVRNS